MIDTTVSATSSKLKPAWPELRRSATRPRQKPAKKRSICGFGLRGAEIAPAASAAVDCDDHVWLGASSRVLERGQRSFLLSA